MKFNNLKSRLLQDIFIILKSEIASNDLVICFTVLTSYCFLGGLCDILISHQSLLDVLLQSVLHSTMEFIEENASKKKNIL